MSEKIFKRTLTLAQSNACECAKRPRCTCRCNGLLHGVNHADFIEMESAIFQSQGYITESQVNDLAYFLKEQSNNITSEGSE